MKFQAGDKILWKDWSGSYSGRVITVNNTSYIVNWEGSVVESYYPHQALEENAVLERPPNAWKGARR